MNLSQCQDDGLKNIYFNVPSMYVIAYPLYIEKQSPHLVTCIKMMYICSDSTI